MIINFFMYLKFCNKVYEINILVKILNIGYCKGVRFKEDL